MGSAYGSDMRRCEEYTGYSSHTRGLGQLNWTLSFIALMSVQETQGVCVATYGKKPDFPAFYTPSSGMKVRPATATDDS
jgi:hypothetical protein